MREFAIHRNLLKAPLKGVFWEGGHWTNQQWTNKQTQNF